MNITRILVVDDDESIRSSYLEVLKSDRESEKIAEMGSTLFEEKGKNLFCDDEAFFAKAGDSIMDDTDLMTDEYEVSEASQGAQAVEMVRKSIAENCPFSLMFLDMRMPPGIDGLETAKQIREIDPHIEIVIMTAYSDYTYMEIVKELGNPERLLYFHKPFWPEQILYLASSLTQIWQLERVS